MAFLETSRFHGAESHGLRNRDEKLMVTWAKTLGKKAVTRSDLVLSCLQTLRPRAWLTVFQHYSNTVARGDWGGKHFAWSRPVSASRATYSASRMQEVTSAVKVSKRWVELEQREVETGFKSDECRMGAGWGGQQGSGDAESPTLPGLWKWGTLAEGRQDSIHSDYTLSKLLFG